jgi:NAD-reducing hydrogenase small subunit
MSPVANVRTLKIDGQDIGAHERQTLLEAARENGIAIPTLCHLDGLSDVGACRLCLVEVKGARRLLPACVTRVEEGMEVTTGSETLVKYRKMILELFFSERNHVCAVCVSNGHCELQGLAESLRGLRRDRGGAYMGRDGARRQRQGDHRFEPALGRVGELHELRQMRPRLPHGRAGRKRPVGGGDDKEAPVFALPDPYAAGEAMSGKLRLATVWLDGCSGCHMSLLDLDERLLELAQRVEFVYSPLVDAKEFPAQVDVTLVEGAVSTEEDERRIRLIRERTKILVSLGDCAVTANVPSLRNPFGVASVLKRVYIENVSLQGQVPEEHVPRLLPRSLPVHHYVKVDVFMPGCPPGPDMIHFAMSELIAGRLPDFDRVRFG